MEDQIDSATQNVGDLKEQNQFLTEIIEKQESTRKEQEEEALNTSDETYVTASSDLTEELFVQVQDLAARLECKLNEMDNFKWSSRPGSSCSGAISVSTEDVSVRSVFRQQVAEWQLTICNFFETLQNNIIYRELSFLKKGKELTPADLADGLRRLDAHFESFVRFEDVIVKKLRDTEIRLEQGMKRQEVTLFFQCVACICSIQFSAKQSVMINDVLFLQEMEIEKQAAQEKMKEQILKISDLESRLDQFRFEPSPNAVTLSGLRARVKSLTEDLEQHKGQLQLKTMEVRKIQQIILK